MCSGEGRIARRLPGSVEFTGGRRARTSLTTPTVRVNAVRSRRKSIVALIRHRAFRARIQTTDGASSRYRIFGDRIGGSSRLIISFASSFRRSFARTRGNVRWVIDARIDLVFKRTRTHTPTCGRMNFPSTVRLILFMM